jgi:ribosome-associated toxin RatA of RatAB toxin-antitoxin module
MFAKAPTTGGRAGARRLFAAAAVALGTLWTSPAPLDAARAFQVEPTVTVRENQGVYFVAARFQVAEPPDAALAVLTDYERIPRFMPNIQKSIVRERGADHVIVEQQAVSKLMMFSKKMHLVLQITEEPDALRFTDVCRADFRRYEGSWTATAIEGMTEIRYELTADPSFDVPEFILKRVLRRDSRDMIAALQQEMAARSAR